VTRALVLREPNTPLTLEDIDLAPTGPGQVRVRVHASGVCRSDHSLATGVFPYLMPVVLGHEGAGVVTEVGDGVTSVAPGDHVVIAWNQPCRECRYCLDGEVHLCERAMMEVLSAPYATSGGAPLYSMQGAGTFAEETLCIEHSVVRIDDDIPLEIAALVGCGVTTGVGAVLNSAKVPSGATVAVVGCGGVGLAAIQAARIAGASRIVAVDVSPGRLQMARTLGATDTIDGSAQDPVATVMELTGRGVDFAFEVVGRSATIRTAYDITRRGGTTVVVGAGAVTDVVGFNALELFFNAKTVMGSYYGSSDPARDFPRFLDMYRRGELDLGAMISDRIDLADVPAAFERMERADGARSVVVFPT